MEIELKSHSDIIQLFFGVNRKELFTGEFYGDIKDFDIPYNNIGEGEISMAIPLSTYNAYTSRIKQDLKNIGDKEYFSFPVIYKILDEDDETVVKEEEIIYTLYFKNILDLGVVSEETSTKKDGNQKQYMFKFIYEFTNRK